jgi:hypothetical protein
MLFASRKTTRTAKTSTRVTHPLIRVVENKNASKQNLLDGLKIKPSLTYILGCGIIMVVKNLINIEFDKGVNMDYQNKLNEHLQIIVGKRLDDLHLVCELMSFSFEEYAFHALGLTRIIHENDILVTTIDYLNWDEETDTNNDEWYFVKQYKDQIVGGTVVSATVNSLYDVVIILDNGIRIETFVKNGYHHYDDECEQWVFFKVDDHSYPFITVWNKTVDIAENW